MNLLTENHSPLGDDEHSDPSDSPERAEEHRSGASTEDSAESLGPTKSSQLQPAVFRFAGLGTELAAYTLVFAGIGYAVDTFRGHDKAYATALGTLVGFTYGMFRFIKQVRERPES